MADAVSTSPPTAFSAPVGARIQVGVVGQQAHSSQVAQEVAFVERTVVLEDALEAAAKDLVSSSRSTYDTNTLAWVLSPGLGSDSILRQRADVQRRSYDMDRQDGVHHLGRTSSLPSLAQTAHHTVDCDESARHSQVRGVHIDRAYQPRLVRWHQEA